MAPVDPTARFVDLMQGPEAAMPLDELALLVAAHARPDLDVAAARERLDELAAGVVEPTAEALCRHLFVAEGYVGDHQDYYDPRNSYLDQVLERRVGIPISLAVLLLEVGRRVGVGLAGVSMPGHFLVRVGCASDGSGSFIDAFDRGTILDEAACAARFRALHGPAARFDPAFLAPVGTAAIVARMLANLDAIATARADRPMLGWVVRLRAALPGAPPELSRRLAEVLAASCRFADAADVLERLAASGRGTEADDDARTAHRLRARLN